MRLLVQGWRFIHHSYALVAQAHSLALLRRGDVELRFEDLPFAAPGWQQSRGILAEDDERTLSALRGPEPDFVPDVTLRFGRDFSIPAHGRVFVFDTPEFHVLRPGVVRKLKSGAAASDRVHVLTPSRWAADPYLRFGLPPERVHVVPHGVDPRILHPDAGRRAEARRKLGVGDGFVFMSVGAMTDNKGIGPLLRAFARVAGSEPHSRLVLKGVDDLYASRDRLRDAQDALRAGDRDAIAARLGDLGDRRSAQDMADLLRAADCYVSPYLAEGFNLPVLEAAACGVPVICTAGGATDDFIDPSFAWRIRSRPDRVRTDIGAIGEVMQPDAGHLVDLMQGAVRDRSDTERMGAAGAAYVARSFTWERVTDLLVEALRAGATASAEAAAPLFDR